MNPASNARPAIAKTTPAEWLAILAQDAKTAHLPHIDLLIDATDLAYPLQDRLRALPVPPEQIRLFGGTPERRLALKGPILLRVLWANAEQQAWLTEFVEQVHHDYRLIAVLSRWPFVRLGNHLRHFTQGTWKNGDRSGLVRYYDPRLFAAVCSALDGPQMDQLQEAVIAWYWLDQQHIAEQLGGLAGLHVPPDLPLPPFTLKDGQLEAIKRWCSAETLRCATPLHPADYGLRDTRHLREKLLAALQAAEAADRSEDQEYALQQLDGACGTSHYLSNT